MTADGVRGAVDASPIGRVAALGMAVAGFLAGGARAQEPASGSPAAGAAASEPATSLPPVEVTGTATTLTHDIPQSIEAVSEHEISEQGISRLQDVLRNVPGITLNAGEGGSHGDSVNLRGLSVPDSFFLDGLRDIGLYQRDTFDQGSVEVLLGPSSVLFGRGSTAGVINQVTKQPMLVPLEEATVEFGTAEAARATADVNWVLGDHAALRVNLMDERSKVADRNYVVNARNGVAPALAFGLNQATTLTLSYLHQYENDLPDYGIPFIDGSPAPVNRRNYYGLRNYDRTKTTVDIATLRLEHKFGDAVSLVDSVRYGRYDFLYLLSAPHLDDDSTEPPAPGTPPADILVYRDQPSSGGTEDEFINRTDLTVAFNTAGLAHTLIAGVELSTETSDVTKYVNGLDVIPPTPLLDPVPVYSPPTPLDVDTLPHTYGSDISFSLMDRIRISPQWDFDAGIRWDRFDTHYREAVSGNAFSRIDTEVSPRAALVFKPVEGQSYYASYGSSYNPAIEYLTLAPSSESLSPEKDYTVEAGAKIELAHRSLALTAALFDTLLDNARQADPDDPTVQQMPFDQRVLGAEVGVSGYVARGWEIQAGYTHLDDRITASTTDPLSLGRMAPNIPTDAFTLWTTWEPGHGWKFGGGPLFMSHRFADTDNTAGVPSYVVLNAMVSYRVSPHLEFQVNVNNIADKLYFNGLYYTEVDENHAVPGPGRTFLLTAKLRY
ncbi:MAG TPA: TonB-dependent siderophore receptor [Opitutaceae bacterium]